MNMNDAVRAQANIKTGEKTYRFSDGSVRRVVTHNTGVVTQSRLYAADYPNAPKAPRSLDPTPAKTKD